MKNKSKQVLHRKTEKAGTDIRAALGITLAVILVTAGAYSRTVGHDFVNYDDNVYITSNHHIWDGLTWESFGWAFTTFHASNWHPVTWLSHMLGIEWFGMDAGGHLAVNVGFHIANAILIFWLLQYVTGQMWAAALVAGLFALHPLRVENVAWVSARKDVLSTFFLLWTMFAYAYYARRPGFLRYLAALLFFALGLLAKPMLVTLPVALLLMDYWPLERFRFSRNGWKIRYEGCGIARLILEKVPLAMMAVASSIVTLFAQQRAMQTWEIMGLSTRVTNAAVSYWRYIRQMFWPEGLAPFYPHSHEPYYVSAAIVFVLMVLATIAVIRMAEVRKYLVFGWFWYIFTLVPVIGLVQVGDQSHADRYTYVPHLGLLVIIAWSSMEFIRKRPSFRKPAAM
ncbi:MAG TPA: hypothetical protein VLH60_05295, partial [Sedimentisphaerales bacterium]|nr:hypothetical protein [Sedimentisphaerales bacterium]